MGIKINKVKNKRDLMFDTLTQATIEGYRYFGIQLEIEGQTYREVIINRVEDMENKINYYLANYSEELIHLHSKNRIEIVDWCLSDDYYGIELALECL